MGNSIKKFYVRCGLYVRAIFITISFASGVHNLIAELPNCLGDPKMGYPLEISSSLYDCTEKRPPEPQKSLSFSTTTSSTFTFAPGSVMKLEKIFPANYLGWKQRNCGL